MVSLERDLLCAIGERGHVDLFTERAAECLNGGVAAKFRDFADVFFFLIEVVSDVIAGNVPSEGYVCRWGGEEILFVVPNTDTESCEKIAKSICQKIHECTFKENSRSFNISMTFGVYSVTPNENYDEGISKVDKLLYKGKIRAKTALYLNKIKAAV